jgi:hypothetical protein
MGGYRHPPDYNDKNITNNTISDWYFFSGNNPFFVSLNNAQKDGITGTYVDPRNTHSYLLPLGFTRVVGQLVINPNSIEIKDGGNTVATYNILPGPAKMQDMDKAQLYTDLGNLLGVANPNFNYSELTNHVLYVYQMLNGTSISEFIPLVAPFTHIQTVIEDELNTYGPITVNDKPEQLRVVFEQYVKRVADSLPKRVAQDKAAGLGNTLVSQALRDMDRNIPNIWIDYKVNGQNESRRIREVLFRICNLLTDEIWPKVQAFINTPVLFHVDKFEDFLKTYPPIAEPPDIPDVYTVDFDGLRKKFFQVPESKSVDLTVGKYKTEGHFYYTTWTRNIILMFLRGYCPQLFGAPYDSLDVIQKLEYSKPGQKQTKFLDPINQYQWSLSDANPFGHTNFFTFSKVQLNYPQKLEMERLVADAPYPLPISTINGHTFFVPTSNPRNIYPNEKRYYDDPNHAKPYPGIARTIPQTIWQKGPRFVVKFERDTTKIWTVSLPIILLWYLLAGNLPNNINMHYFPLIAVNDITHGPSKMAYNLVF